VPSEYLTYGGAPVAEALAITQTRDYLRRHGFSRGYLERAREAIDEHSKRTFTFEPMNANYCDFCYAKLMGGEFDRLEDGRERCLRCTRTVLRTGDEFETILGEVKRNLETAFGITINTPLTARMVNANAIAARSGETFQPTPGVDARVLGFAEQSRAGYSLYIENGSPKLAAVATIAHELTHIWQYLNWDVREIERRYGARNRLAVYEGMSMWVQVQYLLFIKEFNDAERQQAYALQRTDEYGIGFRLFARRYPLAQDGDIGGDTPFRHPFPL